MSPPEALGAPAGGSGPTLYAYTFFFWQLALIGGACPDVQSAEFFSSFQFVDAQFRPQPIEVVSRHFIIAAGEFGRVVFERLEPIDDFGAALYCSYGSARRLVSKHRDWLIEQVPIVPV